MGLRSGSASTTLMLEFVPRSDEAPSGTIQPIFGINAKTEK